MPEYLRNSHVGDAPVPRSGESLVVAVVVVTRIIPLVVHVAVVDQGVVVVTVEGCMKDG